MRIKNFHFPSFLLNFYFLLTIALCGQFFYGRTLQANSAYSLFKVINSETFSWTPTSWSVIWDQALPVIACKLSLPLLIILFLYSVAFPLLVYLLWILVHYYFRYKQSSWLLTIPVLFFVPITMFDMSASVSYGLLFFLAFWCLIKSGEKPKNSIVIIGFFALNIFSHPLFLFCNIPMIALLFMSNRSNQKSTPIIYIILIFSALLFWLQFGEWKMIDAKVFSQFNKQLQFKEFGIWFLLSLLFIPIYNLLTNRPQRSSLIPLRLSFLIILMVFCLYFFISANPWEKTIKATSLVVLITSTYLLFSESIRWNKVIWIPMIVAVIQVWNQGEFKQKKFTYYDNLKWSLREQHHQKYLVTEEELKYASLKSWALSIETLLYSATNRKEPYTFYQCKSSEVKKLLETKNDQFLLVPFYPILPIKSLNPTYFSIKEEPYFRISDTTPQNPLQNKSE